MSLCFSAEYHVLVSLEGCAFATVLPFCGAEVVVTDEPNDDVFACLWEIERTFGEKEEQKIDKI